MSRLVLLPGYVVSKDGDRHFISCANLLRLYQISKPYPWDDLTVVQVNNEHTYRPQIGDVQLRPSSRGAYKLPTPLTKRDINEITRQNNSRQR